MPEARTQSLRRLLLIHELAFLTLVIITGALATVWGYWWQQSSLETIRLHGMSHTAEEIRSLVFKQMHEVTAAALEENPATRELDTRYLKTIQELFNELRRSSAHRAEDYAVQGMQTAFSLLQSNLRETLADPYALNRLVRAKLLDPEFEQRFVADFETAFEGFTGLVAQQIGRQELKVQQRLAVAPWVLSVPVLLGIGLLVLTRRRLTMGFVRPMRAVLGGLRELSQGGAHEALHSDGVKEMQELAQGINRMAAELDKSQRALIDQERQAAQGGLIPVIAHNIRNPLAAIRANAQLLDGSENAAELAEIRGGIIDTVDRLGRWVTALVSYLHPLKPRPQVLKATELLAAVERLLSARMSEQGLLCEHERWDEEARIEADRDLMEQALYGLLNNAVEASAPGATLYLSVTENDGEVRLALRDTGGGIPFRPEPSELTPGPSTKRFGTGLGIPIAFKICHTHGFRLEFNVEPGLGTEVLIHAPAWRPAG
ncbi:MAG: HAMP domain-containing histidine kinase [Gammaproteobacteria bacterium]|nr:HAMP domain-containing histidine kinase [Gammaproteobacteria bacterium]